MPNTDQNNEESTPKKKGMFRRTGSFLKGMTARTLGLYSLKEGNKAISGAYKNLTGVICPICSYGLMALDKNSKQEAESQNDNSTVLYTWICSNKHCDCKLLAGHSKKDIEAVAGRMRKTIVQSELSHLEAEKIESIKKGHKFQSRLYFVVSLLCFLGVLYLISVHTSILVALNWAAFSFMFFVFGLKKSYRYWQLSTGTVYKQGAFLTWLRGGKWFV